MPTTTTLEFELASPGVDAGRDGEGGDTAFELFAYADPSTTLNPFDLVTMDLGFGSKTYRVMAIKIVAEVDDVPKKWAVSFVKAGKQYTVTTTTTTTASP